MAEPKLCLLNAAAGTGGGLQGTITQSASTMPELGPDVKQLSVLVENISPYILHTKIGAPGRWEVPRSLFNAPNVTGASRHCRALLFLDCCLSAALSVTLPPPPHHLH